MITRFVSNTVLKSLTLTPKNYYGELTYTQSLKKQDSFDRVPTYRLIDLDGKLLDSKH